MPGAAFGRDQVPSVLAGFSRRAAGIAFKFIAHYSVICSNLFDANINKGGLVRPIFKA